jgi:DNA adenine methylase
MLVPYLGEKSRLSNFIVPHIPTNIKTYVEPFGGAYGIFFSLKFTNFLNTEFIYNDLNHLNYNLFNQLRFNHDFINQIKDIKVDRNYYLDCLSDLNNSDLFISTKNWLITLCSSKMNKIGVDSWLGDSEFEIFKLKFRAYKYHIDRINHIHNLDYKDIFDIYDSPDTFFYLDPPYKGKESYYINHDFCDKSHLELKNRLDKLSGRFLLSYWYFDGLEDLYSSYKIEKKSTLIGTEYLIKNY